MDNKEAVKRLLLLLGRYKKTIVVIVGCLLVSTGLNLCVPLISRRIMDDGFIGGNKKLLIELVLVSMVIYTINSLIDIVKEKKRVDISAKIQYFLSEQSFSHLIVTFSSETVVFDGKGDRVVACPTEQEAVEYIRGQEIPVDRQGSEYYE